MEFREYEDTTTPREEAETIITYDVERQAWYFYTNYGPHARKWEDKIIPSAGVNSRKTYHRDTGKLIALEGEIDGIVSIRGHRVMTEEQKQAAAERLRKARAQG